MLSKFRNRHQGGDSGNKAAEFNHFRSKSPFYKTLRPFLVGILYTILEYISSVLPLTNTTCSRNSETVSFAALAALTPQKIALSCGNCYYVHEKKVHYHSLYQCYELSKFRNCQRRRCLCGGGGVGTVELSHFLSKFTLLDNFVLSFYNVNLYVL